MYRLLIVSDEPEEQDRLNALIGDRMPGVFELVQVENVECWMGHREDAVTDVILINIDMIDVQGLENLQAMKRLDQPWRILFVNSDTPESNEEMLKGLRRHVQDLDQLRLRREEKRIESVLEASLIPITENLLAILLMLETMQESKWQELAGALHMDWSHGYAMTIAFPQLEGISPTENHMRLMRYVDRVRQFSKLLGLCVASPLLNRYMTIFYAAENEQAASMNASIMRAERLHLFLDYLYGTQVTVGIGSPMPILELRQSYRQSAIAAAYGEAHELFVATIEDVRRSAARRHTEWLKRDTSIEFLLRPELRSMAEELELQRMDIGIK